MGRKAVSCLLHVLGVIFTALLLAAAVVSWRASYVSPERGDFWASIALLMPVILLVNLAAMIWWLARRRWGVAMMPLAALVLNMGYVSSMIQLPDIRVGEKGSDLKVGTLNVNGFRRLSRLAPSARAIARLARREEIDVLCMQEFVEEGAYPADSIAALFAPEMPYFVRRNGQALVSRYPILDSYYGSFPDTDNDYMWADLAVGDDTVRIFSVHLQTSGVSALRRRFRKDYNRDAPVDRVMGEVERNSKIRARQVDEIRSAADKTRWPVVVAGDFNDTPSSYSYRKLKGDLRDGFRAAGNGYGGTFRYLGGLLRIDYIFYDNDRFQGVRYYMPRDDVSDHKMVVAELRLRDEIQNS
ncbi:endonuclease/exonuclease/phosphatase family protein [Alistipes sp.]|uniref:endonuclease/exonuclease/phosphatase family protein n=1 Tax=Alistipes sp. TaxID=1872444 RepID=UPI003AF109DD